MNKKVISLIREMKDDYNYNESIKTLRTNIQFCGSNIHTIMFTSAMPDEGKSDVAFAAASSLAQIGKHVVFIDADIRKSVLVSRYQLTEEVSGLNMEGPFVRESCCPYACSSFFCITGNCVLS